MAFVSIGQKYGFVSIGDSIRRQVAEGEARGEACGEQRGRDEERQKAEEKIVQNQTDTLTVLRKKGLSEEMIADIQSELEALQQSRLSK